MLEDLSQQISRLLPTAALFVAVVIGGLIASAIARRMTRWAIEKTGLDALAERAGAARLLYAIGVRKGVSHFVAGLVYAAGLLATGAAAADILGLEALSAGAAALIAFLPRLAAAGLVLCVGAGVAGLVRRAAIGFGQRRGDVEHPELLGNLAYYGVMTVAVIVASGQAGLETSLVETLLIVVAAITAAAIALAFALGSRHSFHNLVAGHFLSRLARPGDTIRVGDVEGVVIRYFGVCVVLKTADGEVAVPCKVLLDQNIGLSRLGAKARADLDARPSDEG
ncbi:MULTISPECIES: mechanosensitive ion channel domain-containing protein [Nannocystis]|uniref:Mechanosensitive ion channel n=1 Tax=Nannocystis radixulma TaxID=2995305 RepID=A0ABT5B245_9BACT|nr:MULTISPECIES: mechanosensitive ion channel domain-containing protein [Nannocystis]MCY1058929.1 mechanosensitive ion channel [Nannocystis sp. SCPEA4]MDC0668175.1 mechanosensitive ion channel [Nannocystis radixulma]